MVRSGSGKNPFHEKSGCSYLPREGIVAARALNFRVRNGIGCVRLAIAAADRALRPLKTECHSPYVSDKVNRNSAYPNDSCPVRWNRTDRVLGLLVRPGSAARAACTGRPSNRSLSGALTPYRMGGLVSGGASRLDALSVYPGRGRLSGDATGVTTGPP